MSFNSKFKDRVVKNLNQKGHNFSKENLQKHLNNLTNLRAGIDARAHACASITKTSFDKNTTAEILTILQDLSI